MDHTSNIQDICRNLENAIEEQEAMVERTRKEGNEVELRKQENILATMRRRLEMIKVDARHGHLGGTNEER